MAIFPILEVEDRLQINDKTRFNATKSFVTTGSTAIASVEFKPGKNGTAITISSSSSDDWYLDYAFSASTVDVDSTNNKLDFNEGSSELTATISSGEYSLDDLASEIATQMGAVGGNTYTITVGNDLKMTIASTGGFALLNISGSHIDNSIFDDIGFPTTDDHLGLFAETDKTGKSSYTGNVIQYVTKQIKATASDGSSTQSITSDIKVYSVIGDRLFSTDAELQAIEDDILKWVRTGRSSFLDKHRLAQDFILDELDRLGYQDVYGERLVKAAVVDIQEVKEWSKYLTLSFIFEGISNEVGDIFEAKAKRYMDMALKKKDRMVLRLDRDRDGQVTTNEFDVVRSAILRRS